MKSNNSEFSVEYLNLIREIFTKKYGYELPEDKVIRIARNLSRFGAVCSNYSRKKKGLKPMYAI